MTTRTPTVELFEKAGLPSAWISGNGVIKISVLEKARILIEREAIEKAKQKCFDMAAWYRHPMNLDEDTTAERREDWAWACEVAAKQIESAKPPLPEGMKE